MEEKETELLSHIANLKSQINELSKILTIESKDKQKALADLSKSETNLIKND